MVRLRLRKVGSTHQPSYRLVAADRESPRDGRFLENLGYYNPRSEPATIEVNEARVYHWLRHGAQPSESALKLFKVTGTLERYERLKKGEPEEALLNEAEEAASKRAQAKAAPAPKGMSKKAKAKAAAGAGS